MGETGLTSIVLAAGRSERMPGRNKLLLPVDGVAVVRRVAEALLGAGAGPVIVVVGHEAPDVARALEGLPVRLTLNSSYAEGLGTSVAAGVAAADLEAEGYLLCPGDLPALGTAVVNAVVEAFHRGGRASVVAPSYRGQRGHPVAFPSGYRDALAALAGDTGARGILRGARVHDVEVNDPGVLRDVDTPDDYEGFSGDG